MKNIIVLQHIKIEDPGYIKDLMISDGINLTTIELDEGEKIPNDLNKFELPSTCIDSSRIDHSTTLPIPFIFPYL